MNKPTAISLAAAQAALLSAGLARGFFYLFNDGLPIAFKALNITDKIFKQTAQQHIGQRGRAWFSTGRRYTLSLNYSS